MMNMGGRIVLTFLLGIFPIIHGSRILVISQIPTHSHHQTYRPIARELSKRGHEVVFVTPMPIKDPKLTNLTEIDVSKEIFEALGRFGGLDFMSIETPVYTKIQTLYPMLEAFFEATLSNAEFKKIYTDERQKFDLILCQIYTNPIMYAMSAKLKAPIIGVSSMGVFAGNHLAIGNPNPPSIYSEMYLPYNGELTFFERIKSTVYFLWHRLYVHFIAMPHSDQIARKYLGQDIPYLADIEKNISALMITVNPIVYANRPMVPTVVPLSFLHVDKPKPLPKDLKDEIESAKNGVVYFSLGSIVKSAGINERVRQVIMEALAELPYKVLWKFENDTMPGKPKNVVTRKWMPQQDILAHPNVKVFMTQFGLQSLEEAVDREMPLVGIPFISDQGMNGKRLVEWGVAKQIDYRNTTKEEIVKAVMEVAENPIYRENMRKVKKIMQDEPMTGTERMIWWSEYVIRHKGTKHLRSPTVDIEWYKYLLLDVFAVIVGIPVLVLLIIVKLLLNTLKKTPIKKTKTKKN
ncbi:unnamed protein product [Ceutorhynchus assimilis]|uniref:UDP-glucuronosyltransferase n=1 Tax=Ceutorhynchus assimilis TaxID=467358 RepID=A0A9N9QMI3_9CUCU|nr:unnamed protein product [Ceutorhynchus assimilis]